jgi:hypothetical protein
MLNRRDAMIRLGQVGLGALALPGLLRADRAFAGRSSIRPTRGRAKSCILIFLWGGPPQQDLWDLKPDAPEGIRSQFKPSHTNVPGIEICDQMPLLARQMDKVAVVRSLAHKSTAHEPSVYHMLTGRENPMLAVPRNQRRRTDFPGVGSVVSAFSEPGVMPATVTVPRPIGHDGVTYAGTYAGFLGPRHDPMEIKEAPNPGERPTHDIAIPDGIDTVRLTARRGLLDLVETQDRMLQKSRRTSDVDDFREQAFAMISSPAAKRAFNLELEDPRVRERYGRNEYGESFLLARRLVEAGVRLVTVTWMYIFPNGRVSNVWDNHAGYGIHGAKTGYDLLKSPVCIPPLDSGYSALLEDLSQRGLLDETLVVTYGEFGRTPKINGTAGRDHWGMCQSALLAGGGIRGGQVYGSSDSHAAYPKDNPVSPEDLLATMYDAMGIPPDSEIHDRIGRPHRISEGRPISQLFA